MGLFLLEVLIAQIGFGEYVEVRRRIARPYFRRLGMDRISGTGRSNVDGELPVPASSGNPQASTTGKSNRHFTFAVWKDADLEIPIGKQARGEICELCSRGAGHPSLTVVRFVC